MAAVLRAVFFVYIQLNLSKISTLFGAFPLCHHSFSPSTFSFRSVAFVRNYFVDTKGALFWKLKLPNPQ